MGLADRTPVVTPALSRTPARLYSWDITFMATITGNYGIISRFQFLNHRKDLIQ